MEKNFDGKGFFPPSVKCGGAKIIIKREVCELMLLLGKFNFKKSDEKVPITLKHPKLAPCLKKVIYIIFI